MEGGEDVSRVLGDLGNSLPAADFEIGNSDGVRNLHCVPLSDAQLIMHSAYFYLRVLIRILFLLVFPV